MSRKILLAVDLQHDFIHGSLPVPESENVLPEIDKVKGLFDFVYFTLDWHPLNHCSFKEQGGPWPVHCVHHTAGAALHPAAMEGLEESRVRFILKGRLPEREEYGAFVGFDPENQDLFEPGDEVVVCGIAAEYCVLETLKNLYEISKQIGFTVKVYLPGTARFESTATVEAFMKENGIEEF